RMVTNDYIVDIANRDGQLQLNVTDKKAGIIIRHFTV
ncbi:hypothetical protein ACUN9W_13120, partial [Escherichia coli]